jgi:sigma-B regulation protein RsbU (phosphoserine phosphatase)
MADVSGKGVSAALLMANFQAHLRSLAELYPNDLKTVVTKLNQRVIQNAAGEKFITMFLAAYNETTRELQYVNAGHNPPALCSDSHTAILETGTTGLGMIDELSPFEAVNVHIPKGSLLVCYTDGLVEQENAKGEDFGLDKLIEIMQQSSDLKADDFNDELLTQLLIHKGDKPYFDDIALLTCRF